MKEFVNVLIVENDPNVCDMLNLILVKDGYKLTAVTTGKEALIQLKETAYNYIILDLRLPDINSVDLLKAVKKSKPWVSILVITDEADLQNALVAVEEGASSYVIKPFSDNSFKLAFRKGLEGQKQTLVNIHLLGKLKLKQDKIENIMKITDMINSIGNVDDVVNFTITEVTRFLNARRGSFMMVDEGYQYLVIKAAKGIDEKIIKSTKIRIGDGIAGWIAQEGKPIVVGDIEKDPRTLQKNKSSYVTKSFMSMPLKIGTKVRGVINISDRMLEDNPSFTEEDLSFTTIIISQIATALQNCWLQDKINQIDVSDSLTGVFNQRYLYQRLNEEISRIYRYKGTLSLVMLDIDYFKEYNEVVGHIMGNTIIKEIAQIIRENIRGVDTLVRYEGGCFALILPETDATKAHSVAEKIRKVIYDFPFPQTTKQPSGKLTISGGIAEFIKDTTKNELVNRAYQALLEAKKSDEKNKICIYT